MSRKFVLTINPYATLQYLCNAVLGQAVGTSSSPGLDLLQRKKKNKKTLSGKKNWLPRVLMRKLEDFAVQKTAACRKVSPRKYFKTLLDFLAPRTPKRCSKRFRICLDEYLDGFLARVDLDTNRRIAKIHFVSAPIVSANDGVGHLYSRSSDAVPTFASACFRNGKPNEIRISGLAPGSFTQLENLIFNHQSGNKPPRVSDRRFRRV